MPHFPSIELLKATHRFPGPYTFKLIGHSQELQVAGVLALVKEHLGTTEDPPHRVRESEKQNHIALTLEITVTRPEEIIALYEKLIEVPGLILLL